MNTLVMIKVKLTLDRLLIQQACLAQNDSSFCFGQYRLILYPQFVDETGCSGIAAVGYRVDTVSHTTPSSCRV